MENVNKGPVFYAGYYIAKVWHIYMSPLPACLYSVADDCRVSRGRMKTCKICAAVIVLLLVTDMHRYGAWYSGGATYIKPWWQFAYIILWMPIASAALKCVFMKMNKSESTLLWLPVFCVITFTLFFILVWAFYLYDNPFCIMHGYIFIYNRQIDNAAETSMWLTIFVFVMGLIDILNEKADRFISAKTGAFFNRKKRGA